jgi:CPA2 family monovalent cation:H+ antiporter-2
VGGLLAQRLGQPVILGYLVAGVAIGPFTPGPTAQGHSVEVLAEIGVAFLMFALGAEVSLGELRRMGRIAAVGGPLQVVLTMALGPLIAPWLGLSFTQGIFLGGLIALSSTVVALKVLMARGEMGAVHGRMSLGVLIAQDVAVVPMVVVLPVLAAGGATLLQDLGLAALKAGGVLAGAYVVGAFAVPWLLEHVATRRSRELFLLGVVALALGTAMITQLAGLSLAFGAFLAGLAVAETDYRAQVVAEVLPMRDLFTSLFFVSVGMLVNPVALLEQAGTIAALAAFVLIAKVLIVCAIGIGIGMPGRVALLAGLALAQVGEFSFVLARIGVEAGAIPASLFDLILAVALVTIVLTPSMLAVGERLAAALARAPVAGRLFAEPVPKTDLDVDAASLTRHTVICGYGRVARELVEALDARGLRYVVIEYNPQLVRRLRARGVQVIYGDASNPAVIEHAHLESARLLAVLMPDVDAAQVVTRFARSHHPDLDIVVRARNGADVERLQRAGATDVVQPEFEAGVEVIRHALRRYGIGGFELTHLISGRRATFYRHAVQDIETGRSE